MVSTCRSNDSGRPSACTAMLYSLISSIDPSKYFSQTNVKRRIGLFVRPNTPEDRISSTSARSASSLLIADCKWIPPRTVHATQHPVFGGSITQFSRHDIGPKILNQALEFQ